MNQWRRPAPNQRDRLRRVTRRRVGEVSLDRALSKLGLASRTQARELIRDGKVSVDGRIARDPGLPVVPERARIEIEGRHVDASFESRTILLHKPRGVVTTRSDERGRATVYSLLEGLSTHLVPVGRLDMATTGLLLLTNDTQFAAWLTDPTSGVNRTYLVTVRGEVGDAKLKELRMGVEDRGERLKADAIELRKRSGRETHLVVKLAEGKNREIRRLFLAGGFEVIRLKRVSFGGLELGDLEIGRWRELSEDEIKRAFPGAKRKER